MANIVIPSEVTPLSFQDQLPHPSQQKKGMDVIKTARAEGKLDAASFAWLKASLDPWHDTNISNLEGMPDLATGKSICFSSIQEIELSKPASFAAGNWGIHIANYPTLTVNGLMNYAPCTTPATNIFRMSGTVPTQESIVGPVVVQLIANGFVNQYPNPTGNPAVWQTHAVFPSVEHIEGNVRCIGMAIETLNTTAPLYQQGLFTATRFNQGDTETNIVEVWNNAETLQFGTPNVQWVKSAPNTLSQQTLNQQISQWHAKEGSYSVVALKVTEDYSQKAVGGGLGVYTEEFKSGLISGAFSQQVQAPPTPAGEYQAGPMLYQTIGASVTPLHFNRGQRSALKKFPSDGVAMQYTGLSDQTTILLRVRWILERFPNEAQPQVLVLAKPCARYSPFSLELYRSIAQELPPAVMYKENPAGEWWKRILGTIGKVGAPLLSMIPGVGPLAQGLVNQGSTMLLESADADKRERKIHNKANPTKQINSAGKKKKKKNAKNKLKMATQ